MRDRAVLGVAVAVWCGALVPLGTSRWWVIAGLVVVAFAVRARLVWLLVIAAAVTSSLSAGAAWAGLATGESRQFDGGAVLVDDPTAFAGGVRVRAQIEGATYDLRAWGSAAGKLRNRLMGEVVQIEAELRPLADPPMWLRAQGVAGRGTVTRVSGFDVGAVHTRLANSLRRTIESGATSLDRDDLALFTGLVYGDDRAQTPLTADNFTAAGLTHLLAVSGQNVAFVLAIGGPVLRRLGHRRRFVVVLGVLFLFATVTRFESSVVRASTMSAVAAFSSLVGSELTGGRVLALAIAGLIVVDPLIVHSVAFQLSVAASAGILLWSARVARAVPGPRWLAEALAVTSSAQIAVAPLLLWRFDGLPVASLPANLLVGPAAGPVMMWGLTGGLVAGLTPSPVSALLHLPTRLALWWIDSVAAVAPLLGLGSLQWPHVGLLFGAGAIGLRQSRTGGRMAAVVVIGIVLAHPAVLLATAPRLSVRVDAHSTVWRDDRVTVLELDAASRPEDVLAGLRHNAVGDIDLVVALQPSRLNAELIGWIRSRHDVAAVWAAEPRLGVGETVPEDAVPIVISLDRITLTVVRQGDRLIVHPR